MNHEFDQEGARRSDFYALLLVEMRALLAASEGASPDLVWLSHLANAAALLFERLPLANWVGFYLTHGKSLYVGPFQGRVACSRIPFGKGVCGLAASTRQPQLVRDVHEFPGHISCDARSRSELVIPLVSEGKVLGVLDLDSPVLGRFSQSDLLGLQPIAELISGVIPVGPGL